MRPLTNYTRVFPMVAVGLLMTDNCLLGLFRGPAGIATIGADGFSMGDSSGGGSIAPLAGKTVIRSASCAWLHR